MRNSSPDSLAEECLSAAMETVGSRVFNVPLTVIVLDIHGSLHHDILVVVIVVRQHWNITASSWCIPSKIHLVCEVCVWGWGVLVAFGQGDMLLGEL